MVNMKKEALLLMAKKLLSNPRFIVALLVLVFIFTGHVVVATSDGPELPGDPDPSPDPTP